VFAQSPYRSQSRQDRDEICSKSRFRDKERERVEMIIGHFRLWKHLDTLGKVPKPNCRKCGMEEETALYIVCECPAIKSIRERLYGKALLLPEEVTEEPLSKIARFASETGLLN